METSLRTVAQNLPAPADGKRVETGPIQFGDDWPGLFIRGDNCAGHFCTIQAVITLAEAGQPIDPMTLIQLKCFRDDLGSPMGFS